MKKPTRRKFLSAVGAGIGAATLTGHAAGLAEVRAIADNASSTNFPGLASWEIDFRYAPSSWQTAFCFPDDAHKSLIGQDGELRYGHPGAGAGKGDRYFSEVVEFSVAGMESDRVSSQRLEAAGIPIVHTRIDRSEGYLALTTFATNLSSEGRVDNVILEYFPRTRKQVRVSPRITIKTKQDISTKKTASGGLVYLGKDQQRLFMAITSSEGTQLPQTNDFGVGSDLQFAGGPASYDQPLRYFARFPQEGQNIDRIEAGLKIPDELLATAREFWRNAKLLKEPVSCKLPGRYGEFMVACAQNILQAREIKAGKANFQVGPTVYRGLWVVDGNFLLEAASYMGYDAEAQQGLEATWALQHSSGRISAGAGVEHWKDTGIAMFSMVRQAELSQDWNYFRKMQSQVLNAVKFLMELREKARKEGGPNGRYNLLPPGFGDGGLGGLRPELTNTLWVLAGLKATVEAADNLGLSGFGDTNKFYQDLRASFLSAARAEERQHPTGFSFLPMLVKEDPAWSASDPWDRPQPQVAQWALSHAIYPGLLFDKSDPIVRGHIALMQACTQEDVPAETGWIAHEGLWTYNAGFVAQVYLWAGLRDWAHRTFAGYLNHATPLYCWREEQPFRESLVSDWGGDMPHNWASAECVRYLRHMLALEDGSSLRLLQGITESELNLREPYQIAESPTRFGRINLLLEPLTLRRGWRLVFERSRGPQPESVQLPATLGTSFQFNEVKDAKFTREGNRLEVSPEVTSWEAIWVLGGLS